MIARLRASLEPGHMERNVAGGRGEIPLLFSAAVALTALAALMAIRLVSDSVSFSSRSFNVSSTQLRTVP